MSANELGYENRTQPSAAGVMTQTIVVLLLITMTACWAATQYAAWKLAFQPSLGEPLLAFSNGFKIYTPVDFFIWLVKFGHVEGTEQAFTGGEWILASLHFLFVPAIWMAVRRAKKFGGNSTLHGSARWANKEDIHNATLLRRPLTALQRFAHALIPIDVLPSWMPGVKWLKTAMGTKSKGAVGCYVGAWVDPSSGEYHYLTHDGPEHILAFAPTRSGKGVGLVLPTLLSWQHSVLVHDIKGEAWALTAGFRKAKGQKVLKFQPTAMDGSSVRFNPLEEIRIGTMREVADAQNIAQMIVDPDGKGMEDHWAKTGHELLSAALIHILYASREESRTLRGLVSFFCDPSMTIEQVAESMLNCEHDPTGKYGWIDPISGRPTKVHPVVAESARSFLNKSENERSGVQSTAMSFLSLYRDPVVAMNTAVSEFRVDDLMNGDSPVSLYLVVPPNDMARLRPLIRLVINQIIRQRTEMMDFADGRSVAGYKHRMLLMLDEFPALGKLELIEGALAFIAGYGLKCYLITQDLTQLVKAYTKDESIMSNAHIRIAYAPNKFETAELLSKYTGQATVNNAQRSYSGNRLNPFLMHVMAAEQLQGRALLTPDECLRIPAPIKSQDGKNIIAPGDMLILPAGAPPIYGKQILYFKDPTFDGRSKIRPPRNSDRLYQRGDGKPKPIPCDPALAKVAVEVKKSELDDIVKVDEQSGAFLKPTGEVISPVVPPDPNTLPMAAAAVVAAAVVTPVASPAAVPTPVVEYTIEELAILDTEAGQDSSVEAAMNAEAEATEQQEASVPTAATVMEYTAEELAILDTEAGHDPSVEATMNAEADAAVPQETKSPADPESTQVASANDPDGLLDFDL